MPEHTLRPEHRVAIDAVRRFRRKGNHCMIRKYAIASAVLALLATSACSSSGSSSSNSVSSSGSSSSRATGSTWVLGSVESQTGTGAVAVGAVGVLQAWASWTDAHGGIDGHNIKVIVMDDGSNAANSLADAKELVEQDHVIAIVSPSTVFDSTWASYVQSMHVPVIGGLNVTPTWLTNPDFFAGGATAETLIYGFMKAARNEGGTKLAIFYGTESPADAEELPLFKEIAPSAGLQVTTTIGITASQPDYTADCIAAKNAGSNVLTVLESGQTPLRVMQDCEAQGWKPTLVADAGTVYNSYASESALQGMQVSSGVFPYFADATPTEQAFHKALQQYDPAILNSPAYGFYTAATWVGGELFEAAALSGHLGDDPTPSDVVQAMYALGHTDVDGLTPPLTFKPGTPTPTNCTFLFEITDSKFVQHSQQACRP
jgi:branched-chain amino acid transport system substrate-binding protein